MLLHFWQQQIILQAKCCVLTAVWQCSRRIFMEQVYRRVVVTGMGAVSPVGCDVAQTWDSLINGRHGIAPITAFDTTEYKAKVAAEVKNFAPRDYMSKQELLKMDPYAQFAVAAASQAVEDSGIMGQIEPER